MLVAKAAADQVTDAEVLRVLRPLGIAIIGDRKLVVVANFRRTNAYLLQALSKYNAVAVYGDVSPAGKQKAIRKFIEDDACRVIRWHFLDETGN